MISFEILASLIKAGYTESQIKEVNKILSPAAPDPAATAPTPTPTPAGSPPAPTPTPTPTPNPTPATDPTPAPAPAPASVPAPAASTAETETLKLLREILGGVQKNNINNLGTPPEKPEKAEDVLASILEP